MTIRKYVAKIANNQLFIDAITLKSILFLFFTFIIFISGNADADIGYCVNNFDQIVPIGFIEKDINNVVTGRVCKAYGSNIEYTGRMLYDCTISGCAPGYTCFHGGTCQTLSAPWICLGRFGEPLVENTCETFLPGHPRAGQQTGDRCYVIGSDHDLGVVGNSLCSCPTGYYMDTGQYSPTRSMCLPLTCFDSDGDQYGVPAYGNTCTFDHLDCNDANNGINAGVSEICGDGIDQDCSGADLACVCTAGSIQGCTNIISGISSPGTQTCLSDGSAWGACVDNPDGIPCPTGSTQSCTNNYAGQVCGGISICSHESTGWSSCFDDPIDICPCQDAWDCSSWSACSGGLVSRTCTYSGTCAAKPPKTENSACIGAFLDRIVPSKSSVFYVDESRWIDSATYGYFDQLTNPLSITSAGKKPGDAGITTYFSYYPDGSLLSEAHPPINGMPQTKRYTYDPAFKTLSTIIDENSQSTQYTYDDFGRLKKIIKPGASSLNPSTEYTYAISQSSDELVSAKSLIDTGLYARVDAYYDELGRNYKSVQVDLSDTSPGRTLNKDIKAITEFDNAGRPYKGYKPVKINDALSLYTQTAYLNDPLSRPSVITNPDGTTIESKFGIELNADPQILGEPFAKVKDERGYWKKSISNQWGSTVNVKEASTDSPGDSYTNNNIFTYDEKDNLQTITDAESHTTTYTYDSLGRIKAFNHPDIGIINYKYDDLGNLIEKGPVEMLKNGDFEGGSKDWGSQDWTSETVGCRTGNRCFKATHGNWGASQNVKLEPNTVYTLKIWEKDANFLSGPAFALVETAYKYPDPNGASSSTNSWIGYLRSYLDTQCVNGALENGWQERICTFNPTTIIQGLSAPFNTPLSDPDDPRLNVNIYLLVDSSCPAGQEETCKREYNLVDGISLTGSSIKYEYDDLNRLTKVNYPGAWGDVTYSYDIPCANGNGRICSVSDDSGTTLFDYDLRGRVISVTKTLTDQISSAPVSYLTQYSYTENDAIKTITYPDSQGTVTYKYNNFGQIAGVEDGSTTKLASFQYNPASTIDTIKFGTDLSGNNPKVTTEYEYWSRDNLKSIDTYRLGSPANTLYRRSYKYDNGLNLLTTWDALAPETGTKKSEYTYDKLNRLETNPISETSKSFAFTYDKAGNRFSETVTGAQSYTKTYGYDYATGSHSQKLNTVQVSAASTTQSSSLNYDEHGNQIKKSCASNEAGCISASFDYDPENRLTYAYIPGTKLTEIYTYDYTGLRVRKEIRDSKGTTAQVLHYIYDSLGNVILENDFKGCSCPNAGDPNGDGIIADILDAVSVVNVAFRGVAAKFDPYCPYGREDVDASGAVDVLDVVKTVNVAFRNFASGSQFNFNPCSTTMGASSISNGNGALSMSVASAPQTTSATLPVTYSSTEDVYGLQFAITFDKAKYAITPGLSSKFSALTLVSSDQPYGKLIGIYSRDAMIPAGSDALLILNVQALTGTVDPTELAIEQQVLANSLGQLIPIANALGPTGPTPTPQPSQTPTPTPTATPIPTPTPTPTVSSTPTPTATFAPSPMPSISVTPTPSPTKKPKSVAGIN